jgi:hypothetical protein
MSTASVMDYASYRAVHPAVRTQRTTTLMEGGACCDFRIVISAFHPVDSEAMADVDP